jgi:hypothetical protein
MPNTIINTTDNVNYNTKTLARNDRRNKRMYQCKEANANAEQGKGARFRAGTTHDVNQPKEIDHRQDQLAHQKKRKVGIIL